MRYVDDLLLVLISMPDDWMNPKVIVLLSLFFLLKTGQWLIIKKPYLKYI